MKPLAEPPQVGEYFMTEKAGVVRIGKVGSFGDVYSGPFLWKSDGTVKYVDGNTMRDSGPLLYKVEQGERMEQEIDTMKEPLLLPRAVEWRGMLVCGGMMAGSSHNVRLVASPDTYVVTREQESDPVIADLCARVRALAKPWKSAGDLGVGDLDRLVTESVVEYQKGRRLHVRDYCARNRIKIKGA